MAEQANQEQASHLPDKGAVILRDPELGKSPEDLLLTHCPFSNCNVEKSFVIPCERSSYEITTRLLVIHMFYCHLDDMNFGELGCWCGETWDVGRPFFNMSDEQRRPTRSEKDTRIFDLLIDHMNEHGGIHKHYAAWRAESSLKGL